MPACLRIAFHLTYRRVIHHNMWDGKRFGDMTAVLQIYQNLFAMIDKKNYFRLTISSEGNYELYIWILENMAWKLSWSLKNSCYTYHYNSCGSYSYCYINTHIGDTLYQSCNSNRCFIPKLDKKGRFGLVGVYIYMTSIHCTVIYCTIFRRYRIYKRQEKQRMPMYTIIKWQSIWL